jgi:hemin uptake protein HemP
MPPEDRDRSPPAAAASAPCVRNEPALLAARATPRISSERLFAGAAEIEIDHHGAVYRLKRTALGKLILTK